MSALEDAALAWWHHWRETIFHPMSPEMMRYYNDPATRGLVTACADKAATEDADGPAAPGEGNGTGAGEREAQNGSQGHPERQCWRCGGPNIPWSAPSPLWNQVMRGGDINGDEMYDGIVCPTCFAILAREQGVADLWRFYADRVLVPLQTVTPNGRVWDERTWLWREPGGSQGAMDAAIEAVAVATESHYIDLSQTDADGHTPCICGQWWDGAGEPGWDEHMADIGVRAAEPLLRQAAAEEIALRLRDAGLVGAVEIAREVGRG